MSDDSRRQILILLKEKDMTPTEISKHFQFTMPAISTHLRILKNSDLVVQNKIGKNRIYSLNREKALEMMNFFAGIWDYNLKSLKEFLENQKGGKKMSDNYSVIYREIIINAPIDKVFLAVSDQEQLTNWFPDIAVLEKREGGRVSFKFLKENKKNLDRDHEMTGEVIKFIPNNELSYTWNFKTKPQFSKDTIVTWRFESLDKNKTKVTLSHSGFTENDRQQYDEHEEGWTWFVTRLGNYLTKGEP